MEKVLILGKIEGNRRRQWQRMKLLDGITDSEEFEQTMGDSAGQRSLACYGPWGHKESDMTKRLNSNNNNNNSKVKKNKGQEFLSQRDLIQFPNCYLFLTFGKILVQIWDVNISSACGALLDERDSFSFETSLFYTVLIRKYIFQWSMMYKSINCRFLYIIQRWELSSWKIRILYCLSAVNNTVYIPGDCLLNDFEWVIFFFPKYLKKRENKLWTYG